MLRMTLNGWLIAELRESDYNNREAEGCYYRAFGDREFHRLPMAIDLDDAKQVLIGTLSKPCREFVRFEEVV